MRRVYVADVGDCLCMAVHAIFGETIQVDCGSQDGSEVALNGLKRISSHFYSPDVFCLSHFHGDHYNGLLYASVNPRRISRLGIRAVYYPCVPEFKEKVELLKAIFAMNLRLFGDETGVMAYDLSRTISRINDVDFYHRSLSKGDVIDINGSFFHVLWPPTEIHGRTLARVRRALEDFHKAIEEDQDMRRLYEHVTEEGLFREYLKEEGRKEPRKHDLDLQRKPEKRRKLPEVVKKANKSLRCAANHLSLALFEDNRLLFLGDTGGSELKQIVKDLNSKARRRFRIFITPHHGTRWNYRLKEIRCTYSVSSAGKKLVSKINPGYKSISRIALATHVNGDIVIPRKLN